MLSTEVLNNLRTIRRANKVKLSAPPVTNLVELPMRGGTPNHFASKISKLEIKLPLTINRNNLVEIGKPLRADISFTSSKADKSYV